MPITYCNWCECCIKHDIGASFCARFDEYCCGITENKCSRRYVEPIKCKLCGKETNYIVLNFTPKVAYCEKCIKGIDLKTYKANHEKHECFNCKHRDRALTEFPRYDCKEYNLWEPEMCKERINTIGIRKPDQWVTVQQMRDLIGSKPISTSDKHCEDCKYLSRKFTDYPCKICNDMSEFEEP